MAGKLEQLDFFIKPDNDNVKPKAKALEAGPAISENKPRRKAKPHETKPPSGLKWGGWERDYYGNDPNNPGQ